MLRSSAQLHPADARRRLNAQQRVGARSANGSGRCQQTVTLATRPLHLVSEKSRGWGSGKRYRGRACAEEDAERWQNDGTACRRPVQLSSRRACVRVSSTRLLLCTPIEQQSWQVPMPAATLGRCLAAAGLADFDNKRGCN